MTGRGRLRLGLVLLAAALLAVVCTAEPAPRLSAEDVRWLNRVTYGIDSATVARYRLLGRKAFLEEQLKPEGLQAPPEVEEAIAGLGIPRRPLEQVLAEAEAENRRIQALPDDDTRQQARQAQNQAANQAAAEAARRHLLRALWSPAQVREQMAWFWLNHFSVFQGKGNLRWSVADYEERAIRPHALGRFRDLVLATLRHPAMLVYLDNVQSAAGRLNENYARELLELHTLGVEGGYSQADVQELARILTGVGVNPGPAPGLKPLWRPLYVRDGAFEFNPARHDFGAKTLLGSAIPGTGYPEVERAVDLLAAHPATARFVCRRLALYWVGAPPPPALAAAMAKAFEATGGDIPAVLRVLFASRPFQDSLGRGFRDPMHHVAATLRLAYDGRHPLNMGPAVSWLQALGEPLYGHGTPDGYALGPEAWTSPGQLARRFEIARAIGSGNAGLFDGEPGARTGFPRLASRLFFDAVEPMLGPATLGALDRAASQQEWNSLLLSSPEFMAR